MIAPEWAKRLHEYVGRTVRGLGGVSHGVGGVADHVHVLVRLKPTHRISDFMCDLKSGTSSWCQENLFEGFGWQEGYAAFSVSASAMAAVEAYILNQEAHHMRESSSDELRPLLLEEGIEYDERFFV